MRASPPIEVAVNRFAWWRGAVGVLALATAGVIVAWIGLAAEQRAFAVWVAVALVSLGLVVQALALARGLPFVLRWDGRRWQLSGGTWRSNPAVSGRLEVSLDLGSWMLLRFAAEAHSSRGGVAWLPVQRRGLEAQWHGLRCAVHSPQASAESDSP